MAWIDKFDCLDGLLASKDEFPRIEIIWTIFSLPTILCESTETWIQFDNFEL